ncbi:ribonuclease P protein subunit p25-like protein isoform X2 [Paramacrobiotus metropolitanus]|uniref:ribonuclease P protein subunit p25-like protein isoform X2 n=1 Tax=Paramacrobiotus metropolitanus TaxID=2943436 RepID=UPI002445ECF1|nr:ribonuclease P protein subunit p25-like protein isoform X2 [Paramacrobiotus metropolitanus]
MTLEERSGAESSRTMDNYEKGETVEKENNHREPFQHVSALRDDTPVITVRGGSKIQSLVDVALSKLRENIPEQQKFVIFYGSGPAINKTISCVEIFKRRVKDLYQINKLGFEEVEEIWNPKIEGLNVLKVSRKIPALHVLLSKVPLPKDEPGYQQ